MLERFFFIEIRIIIVIFMHNSLSEPSCIYFITFLHLFHSISRTINVFPDLFMCTETSRWRQLQLPFIYLTDPGGWRGKCESAVPVERSGMLGLWWPQIRKRIRTPLLLSGFYMSLKTVSFPQWRCYLSDPPSIRRFIFLFFPKRKR